MALGMSCVGGLAGWYLHDPTLGGLIKDKDDPYGGTPIDEEEPVTANTIPVNKKTYIFHTGCVDEGKPSTLLSASNNSDSEGVGMWCQGGTQAKWILEPTSKVKYPTYYIKNVKYSKYLKGAADTSNLDNKGIFIKEGSLVDKAAASKWKISWNDKTKKTFSIQLADTSQYLSVYPAGGCKWSAKGSLFFPIDNSTDKSMSHWKFKPDGSSISTGADKNAAKCGN